LGFCSVLYGAGFGLIRVYFRVQVRFGSWKKPGFWFGSFLLGSGSFPSLVKMENFGLAKDGAKVGPFPDLELATGKARATDSEAVYRRLARCTELDGAGNSSQSTPVPAKILSISAGTRQSTYDKYASPIIPQYGSWWIIPYTVTGTGYERRC